MTAIYRIILLSLFALILSIKVSAQFPFGQQKGPSIKGKISGLVVDSISEEGIPFATLALRKLGSLNTIDGVLTDMDGNFRFSDVLTGEYEIIISFLGYEDKTIKEVETTLRNPDKDLGKISIVSSAVLMDALEITEERSLIENKVDRLVFNAENDASIAGGDATDVLRKVPLLSVDLNGNVSLRGSESVRILINGKPSGMFSSNVGDALKMFPADQIKQVEVITAPSARYDGEGSAGIINIITKRKSVEGMAGSVNASAGIRQNSLFTNLNIGKGRLGLSSNAAVFYSNPASGNLFFRREDTVDDVVRIYEQSGRQRTSRLAGNGNFSAFYDFNAFHSINSSFNFRGAGFNIDGSQTGFLTDPSLGLTNTFSRRNVGKNFNGGYDWNTDYTIKFENQTDRELSFGFQLSRQASDQNFSITETHDILSFINRDANIYNDGDNVEYTYQADYTHPFSKKLKLETGVKAVIRRIESDFRNEIFDAATNMYIPQGALTNIFDYDQDVYAAYASINTSIAKKYSMVAGVRYEATEIGGLFRSGDSDEFTNRYENWLPSITVSRSLKKFRTLKYSFTQRIQRPGLNFVNPFVNNVDFLNRTIGNPQLGPELASQHELSYNTSLLGFTIFSSVYFRRTTSIVEQIVRVDENAITTNTFDNVGTNNSWGTNIFTTKSIGKFTIRAGGNVFSYNGNGVVNGIELNRKSYEYSLFMNGDYTIKGSIKADFFSFFRSPRRTLQGDNPSFSIYGFGVRKDFKRSSIGINVIEPHKNQKEFNTDVSGPGFTQINQFSIPFRSIGVNYRYRFGSVDFKERKSKVKNTDVKTGESMGDMQGGGAGPGRA
jgi:ferric enterobactin receptor